MTSDWFTDPAHPLVQHKYFVARQDDLVYYITATRGATLDYLPLSDEVSSVIITGSTVIPDNSREQMVKLQKYIGKPVR